MPLNRCALSAALACCALANSASAQLPAITVSALQPAGGKAGSSVDLTVAGVVDGEGIDRLIFSHPGIKATAKTVPSTVVEGKTDVVPNQFVVAIGADVPTGIYDVRAAGTFGVSNPRSFAVGRGNELPKPAGNQTSDTAAPLAIGDVVNGVAAANGEDWYKLTAKKGSRVLFDVVAQRIDSKIDATLVVYDASKRELARSRDVNRRDPMVDLVIPADGDYFVKVYDFTFGGGPDYFYRLAAHVDPYIDFVFPPVVRIGMKNKLTVYGRNLPGGAPAPEASASGRALEKLVVEVDVPAGEPTDRRAAPSLVRSTESLIDAREFHVVGPRGPSNSVALGYAHDPVVVEVEPNDTAEQSQKVTLPCEFVGQFQPRGDTDSILFDAKKGEAVAIDVVSQRMGFTADPFVVVQQQTKGADGKTAWKDLKELDDETKSIGSVAFDSATNDPYFLFTVPEDGTYRIVARDLYGDGRGDPRLIYRLVLRKPRPDFRLAALPLAVGVDRNVNGQSYKASGTFVRAGDVGAVTVMVLRQDGFAGEVRVRAEGLPQGVTANEAVIGPGVDAAILTLAVAESAPAWSGPIRVTGRAAIDGKEQTRVARPAAITAPGNQRKPADSRMSHELYVALGGAEKMPCTILLGEGKAVEAAQAAKVEVPIQVVRRGDFKDPLTLNAVGLPANVKAATVTVAGGATSGKLTIEAANNAPLGEFSVLLATVVKSNYARDKQGAETAMKTKQELEKIAADLTAAAEAAKKAAAAAAKEKKAEADKVAAAAADKAKKATDAAKAAATAADAKSKAAAPKQVNNIPVVSSQVVLRIVEAKKDPKQTAKK